MYQFNSHGGFSSVLLRLIHSKSKERLNIYFFPIGLFLSPAHEYVFQPEILIEYAVVALRVWSTAHTFSSTIHKYSYIFKMLCADTFLEYHQSHILLTNFLIHDFYACNKNDHHSFFSFKSLWFLMNR